MNRQLLSSCLLVIITLSQTDRGWSQTAGVPNLVHLETQSPTHIPVTLPIRLFWNYLVIVEGSIGDVQRLHFLVDTGAYPSVVDQNIAHTLGLVEQPARVNLSNKTVQTRLVTLPSLLLGPVRVEALAVLTQDLSFLRKALGYKVDAIIGLDVHRRSSFTINYRTKEMLFGPVEGLTFSAPFDTDVPIVTIRTRLQNQQLRLVVDTGSPDVMLFESRMSDSTTLQKLGTQKTANASGTLQLTKIWIPELYLGQETIGGQAAVVVDDHKDDGDNFDGVLGMKGPQFAKIAFDFERRQFSWELPVVPPAITVAVYDDVQLSPRVLAEAQDEATGIYQKAGVTVSWIECKSSKTDAKPDFRCQDPPSPMHLNLRIVSHASKTSDSIFGVAFLSAAGTGGYSDVSIDSVEELDRDWHVGLARVLGDIMAHELGHLLLGSNAHSRQGIMCPNWHGGEPRLASTGPLLFSEEQARFMRERLER